MSTQQASQTLISTEQPSRELTVRNGDYPHIFWIDVRGDNRMVECAVVNHDTTSDTRYIIQLNKLDAVDHRRMASIISDRRSSRYRLCELMEQITLQNGINALTYFHQFVEVITKDGRVFKPTSGVRLL